MSAPVASKPDPRRRLNAVFVAGSPEVTVSTASTASSSNATVPPTSSRFSQPVVSKGYLQKTASFIAGLEKQRGSGLPNFKKNKPIEIGSSQSQSDTTSRKKQSSSAPSSQGWKQAPVRMDDVMPPVESKSQPVRHAGKSASKSRSLRPSSLDMDFSSSEDELQLKPPSPNTLERGYREVLFTSPPEMSQSQGNKRKVSSTKSQGAIESPKKVKTTHRNEAAAPRRVDSSSKAKDGSVGQSRKNSTTSGTSTGKSLGFLAAEETKKSDRKGKGKTIDLSGSSPAQPTRAKKGDWSDNDAEISDPDPPPSKPKVKLTVTVRQEGQFRTKMGEQTTARSTSTGDIARRKKAAVMANESKKPAALATKNANVSSPAIAESTPKPTVRPRPTVKPEIGNVSYQSRDRARESSTESEGVIVAASSSAKKDSRTAGPSTSRGPVTGQLSVSSNKENGQHRVRPVATASLTKKKTSSGPSPATFTKVGSSSATKAANNISVMNLDDGPKARRPALKEHSPVRQSLASDARPVKRRKSKAPKIESDSDNSCVERFGNSTQAVWIKNAFDGRDMEEDGPPGSQHSRYSESEDDDDNARDPSEERAVSGALCPFCDGPLPPVLSKGLYRMLERLCKRLDVNARQGSSNPNALSLEVSVTAAACKRHRDEHTLIPKGLQKNYPAPSEIDFSQLRARFMALCFIPLSLIVTGVEESAFFDTAKQEWEQLGPRRMANVASQFGSFLQELPGYYGHQGFEVLKKILEDEFVEHSMVSPSRIRPLDVESYLRRVLIPEAAVRLIQDDQQCDYTSAVTILSESRAYGAAAFGHDGSQDLPETKAERKERKMEIQSAERQREAILEAGGRKARVLTMAQKAVDQLRALLPSQA